MGETDLISRQAALDKINERQRKLIYCFGFENDMVKIMDIAKNIVTAMPSAQPERMRGQWIDITNAESIDYEYKCSECGFHLFLWSDLTNYCPNCGADMREGT